MSELVAAADVVAKVREIAAAKPDFVYAPPLAFGGGTNCVYVEHDGAGRWCPSCLIGHALIALGVDPERLTGRQTVISLAGTVIADEADSPAMRWLGAVQVRQDQRAPWGRAVAHADIEVPL